MPPDPKPLREQPTRNRLLKPVKVESVGNEQPKTKESKKELQALANKGQGGEEEELPSALAALRTLKDKYQPTISKPSAESPKKRTPEPPLPEPNDEEDEPLTEEGENNQEDLVGKEEERTQEQPSLSSKLSARLKPEERNAETLMSCEDVEEGGPEEEGPEEGSGSSELEESEEGGEVQSQPQAPKASSLMDAISPDVTRQITNYLKQVQLHALEQADRILQAGKDLSLGTLVGTVKDLAELQVLLKWQAKLEKEILKGKVPLLPPGAGKFPGLTKLAGLGKKLKAAVGAEPPDWAGDMPSE